MKRTRAFILSHWFLITPNFTPLLGRCRVLHHSGEYAGRWVGWPVPTPRNIDPFAGMYRSG